MRLLTVPLFVVGALTVSFFCINRHTASAAAYWVQTEKAADAPDDTTDVMKEVSIWELDNKHTSLVCAASHFGLSYIYGRFNECSGTVELDFEKPDSTKFRFRIETKSVDTNDANRDAALRGQKGFDIDLYDSITFESTAVKIKDKTVPGGKTKRVFLAKGNLSLHGETRQIDIPLELLAMGKGADGEPRCGFISKFVVFRSDFGMDEMTDTVGDSVAVTFCFQAVRKVIEKEEVTGILGGLRDRDRDGKTRFEKGAGDDNLNEIEDIFQEQSDDNEGTEKKEMDNSPGQLQIEK